MRRATTYSLIICLLYALQHPLSAPAAIEWPWFIFVIVTETTIALSIPFLLFRKQVRDDYRRIFSSGYYLKRLPVFLGLGIAGLVCYYFGLRNTPAPIVAVILNISPLWAALVDLNVNGTKLMPGFLRMFCVAFIGVLISVYFNPKYTNDLQNLNFSVSWLWAVPVPILYALSGTLVGKWFSQFHYWAGVVAVFTVSALPIAIVGVLASLIWLPDVRVAIHSSVSTQSFVMFILGTIVAAIVARIVYQAALKESGNDNGFVSMFFLTIPFITLIATWIIGIWVESLRQPTSALSIVGMVVTAVSVVTFTRKERHAIGHDASRKG